MTSGHEEESGDHASTILLMKGKRTKRQRSASPLLNTAAISSGERSSSLGEETGQVEFRGAMNEDEDMANCLMWLSQGHKAKLSSESSDHFSTRKMSFLKNKQPVGSLGLGLGLGGVYQCKTCDKSFHSFQALGGHRASHKKPKHIENIFKCDEKKPSLSAFEKVESKAVGSFLSLQVTSRDGNKKPDKTHACWICKAEFSSGQALGGHMRRHRGLTVNANATIKTVISLSNHEESMRPTSFLELDLNLPASEDEHKFAFASKNQILSFAAASNSLIDCHH